MDASTKEQKQSFQKVNHAPRSKYWKNERESKERIAGGLKKTQNLEQKKNVSRI